MQAFGALIYKTRLAPLDDEKIPAMSAFDFLGIPLKVRFSDLRFYRVAG